MSNPAPAQGPLTIGVDADPAGNEPTALASTEPCISVNSGDVFDVDIFVREVQELLAWEVYMEYDPAILEVVARDVEMFQAANSGSSVFDASSRVPDRSGLYRAAAADTSDPATPDSGSGILFRLSLEAHGSGISKVELAIIDVDGDGAPDIGPLLRNVDAEILGDLDGDAIFDGPIENAKVAVDTACPNAPAASTNSSPDGDGVSPVLTAIAATGGAIVLLGVVLLAIRLARRRAARQ